MLLAFADCLAGHRSGGRSQDNFPTSLLPVWVFSISPASLGLSFSAQPSSLQQPRHYCRRFIFRVKATELQIRQGLKQIDKRKVFVFEAVWMRGPLAQPVEKLLSLLVSRVTHVGCLFPPPRSERRWKHKKQLKSPNRSPWDLAQSPV